MSYPTRQLWRRGSVVAVTVCASAAVAVSWFACPSDGIDGPPVGIAAPARVTIAGARVLVAPFVNRTGEPTLDALGRVAAVWITEGVSRIDGLAVVLGTASLAMDRPRQT